MTLSFKRTLLTTTLIGLLMTSLTYGSASDMLTKTYNLIHGDQQVDTTALIYNGEIYINLADMTNATGLSMPIDGNTIAITDTYSTGDLISDEDGNLYSGDLKNGLPHGQGTRYLKNGGKYEGEWIDGAYEGQGTLVLPNGNIYVGTFSKGFIHGQGKMFYPDASYYEGHFAYGIQEGLGLLYIDHDNKYEGYWSNGLRNGQGKAYIDGRYKKGLWENNKMIKTLPDSAFDF